MLKIYCHKNNKTEALTDDEASPRIAQAFWVDLHEPDKLHEKQIEEALGIEVPTREEMQEIEISSRLYEENNSVYATVSLVTKADTDCPEIHSVTFIMAKRSLVTIRYSEPSSFYQFSKKLEKNTLPEMDGKAAAIGLFDCMVDRAADVLESTGHKVDELSKLVFSRKSNPKQPVKYDEVLAQVGAFVDLTSKIRESLLSMQRATAYISQNSHIKIGAEEHAKMDVISRDIHSLSEYVSFISNKLSFLLDATLGMISNEQNSIIKIFSVAAVIFLPPTLVASIYGMNFEIMPELKWHYGYPFAILMMIGAAVVPYYYFKRKGWL